MKVLFIGGTGVISSGVSPLAVERGIELYLLNRGQRGELFPKGAHQIVADVGDRASVRKALEGQSFDVVVDWLVFTPEQLEADIALFTGRTGQYIFISSASAYQKPPTHSPITESTPVANPYWQYSRDKIACEDRLMREYREKQFPMTVVRPSHTYGLTMIPSGFASWTHPWTLVDRMRRGKKIIVHGDGTSLWTMTHNSDFGRAFVGLLGNPAAVGHTFHITSDEALTWDQITLAIGRAAGVQPDIIHIASDFISAFDPEARGSLIGDKAQLRRLRQHQDQELCAGLHRHGAVLRRREEVGGMVRGASRALRHRRRAQRPGGPHHRRLRGRAEARRPVAFSAAPRCLKKWSVVTRRRRHSYRQNWRKAVKEKRTGELVGSIVGNVIAIVIVNSVLLWRQYTHGVVLESWVDILWAANLSFLVQIAREPDPCALPPPAAVCPHGAPVLHGRVSFR